MKWSEVAVVQLAFLVAMQVNKIQMDKVGSFTEVIGRLFCTFAGLFCERTGVEEAVIHHIIRYVCLLVAKA